MRVGVRLGLDPGDARIGVARSDAMGVLATPVETIPARNRPLRRIRELVKEHQPIEIVVGLPRSLSGAEGPAAVKVRAFATKLARAVAPVSVRLVDERMTTISAEAVLRSVGRKGQDRRAIVDQQAAVIILQQAVDSERATGAAPGEIVEIADE